MKHLDPDDLVLLYYGELPGADEAQAHLGACPECRASHDRLRQALDVVALDAPPRGDDYGRRVWERLEPRLATGRGPGRLDPRRAWRRRAAGFLAIAAALVVAFVVGRKTGPEPAPRLAAATGERVLLVAVGDHLERSRVILMELAHADPDNPGEVSARRVRAEELLDASRLYRISAERAGETGIASVLGDVERVLAEVANAPESLSPPDVRDLGERIEQDGLLFKVQVMGLQVQARQRALRHGNAGSVS